MYIILSYSILTYTMATIWQPNVNQIVSKYKVGFIYTARVYAKIGIMII